MQSVRIGLQLLLVLLTLRDLLHSLSVLPLVVGLLQQWSIQVRLLAWSGIYAKKILCLTLFLLVLILRTG